MFYFPESEMAEFENGRLLGLGSIRAVCMGLVLIVAVFILGWMFVEQGKVAYTLEIISMFLSKTNRMLK